MISQPETEAQPNVKLALFEPAFDVRSKNVLHMSVFGERDVAALVEDEPTARNWNSIVRIEVRAAVHPPRAGQNQREPIGGVGVWGAHVTC